MVNNPLISILLAFLKYCEESGKVCVTLFLTLYHSEINMDKKLATSQIRLREWAAVIWDCK